MKKVLFIAVISILLSGCGSDIDLVKNGTMNFNKTTTVGKVLDNWAACDSREWKSFKTKTGVRVVSFTCHQDDIKYGEDVKRFMLDNCEELESYCEIIEENPFLDLKSTDQVLEFTVNKDESFQIKKDAVLRFLWGNDRVLEEKMNASDLIKNVYENGLNDRGNEFTPFEFGMNNYYESIGFTKLVGDMYMLYQAAE